MYQCQIEDFYVNWKVDFERWKSEDGDGDEEEEVRDVVHDYPDLYKKLHKEEFGYIKGKFTMTEIKCPTLYRALFY